MGHSSHPSIQPVLPDALNCYRFVAIEIFWWRQSVMANRAEDKSFGHGRFLVRTTCQDSARHVRTDTIQSVVVVVVDAAVRMQPKCRCARGVDLLMDGRHEKCDIKFTVFKSASMASHQVVARMSALFLRSPATSLELGRVISQPELTLG